MTKYLTNHQSANQWHTLHKLIHFLLFFVSIPVFSCLCFIRGAPFFCKNFVQWIDVCLVVVLPGAEVFVGGERGCILQDWCHWRWCSGFNATKDKTCCQKSKITPNLTQSYKYLATSSNSEDPMPWVDLSSSPSLFFHVFFSPSFQDQHQHYLKDNRVLQLLPQSVPKLCRPLWSRLRRLRLHHGRLASLVLTP